MTTSQTLSTELNCTVSDLSIRKPDGQAIAHLSIQDPFQLSAHIEFSDAAQGEFVRLLMPAGLTLRATFYARPERSGRDIELSTAVLNTEADRLSYTAIAEVMDPKAVGLSNHETYQLGVVLRVGTTPFCMPSLMRGFVEGTPLQIGVPVRKPQVAEAIAPAKASAPEAAGDDAELVGASATKSQHKASKKSQKSKK